ncbi:MAG: AAA family ATPase [Candidatus Hermodarchaeota archaeon]
MGRSKIKYNEEIRKVRIRDAYKGDAGRGRIRIDPVLIQEMGLKNGDVIEIAHPNKEKKTAALLFPGKEEDRGSGSIRIDPSLRRNLSASLDDTAEICKVEASAADLITLAGLKEAVVLKRGEELVRMLENRVITKGDILSFNAMGRRVDFIVVDFSPKVDVVRINLNTKVIILQKTYKDLLILRSTTVGYKDIGGLDKEIQIIRDIVELPLKHPELFKTMGIDPPKGILLYGAPGTGKTLLAKAVAHESKVNFITISGPEIMSKFYGQSEENLRKLFQEAEEMAPSIIFIDQLDSIAPKDFDFYSQRERSLVAQLLILLDGIMTRGDIVVIGETNRIEDLSESLRRPGRFDKEIELKAPDVNKRYQILMVCTREVPLNEDVDLKLIAERTDGYVGADLNALVRDAAMLSMKEILPHIDYDKPIPSEILSKLQIKMEHFLKVVESIEPSIQK